MCLYACHRPPRSGGGGRPFRWIGGGLARQDGVAAPMGTARDDGENRIEP